MLRTWLSRLLACCRNCAHPVPVEADMMSAVDDDGSRVEESD